MNNKISTGLAWSYGERILAQAVSFVVSIVLARIISPDEFGLIAMVMIFIDICNVFVTSGLGSGLIQKKDVDEIDFSTVFWVSLGLGLIIYAIVYALSPTIEGFFHYQNMAAVLRVMGLRLILASINTIQHAYVSRKMIFKKFFFATLFGTVVSAVVGIVMAVKGYGVWAIVGQYLTNTTIDTIFLTFTLDWHPKFILQWERIGYFIRYGWKVLTAALIDNIYTNLRSFIIGKRYTSADLAYYNKGIQFPSIIVTNINSSIIRVMFPALSVEQDDKNKMREMVKRSVQISAFLLCPLLVGLMVISKPLITILLTEKWIDCIPYIYVFSLTYLFMPIHAINEQAIKATGHSEITLKVEITKKVVGVVLIILSIVFYDKAITLALSFLAYSLVALVINSLPGKKLYHYGTIEQIRDVLSPLSLSLIMGSIVYPIQLLVYQPALVILLQVIIGIMVYIGLSRLTKNSSYDYLMRYVQDKMNHNKQ